MNSNLGQKQNILAAKLNPEYNQIKNFKSRDQVEQEFFFLG